MALLDRGGLHVFHQAQRVINLGVGAAGRHGIANPKQLKRATRQRHPSVTGTAYMSRDIGAGWPLG